MADPEVDAMGAVATALGQLEDDARIRVVRWAADRFGVTLNKETTRTATLDGGGGSKGVTEEEISAEAPTYEHFAELFNAAAPKTDVDKALVAGYWFQSVGGKESFQSADLQRELKNLGHAIKNITDALDSNIHRKPARVLQLSKSGSSKQARKTYKLTHEGLIFVQGMMAAATA